MNNLLQNQAGCDLIIWETQPTKRNKNNEIKFIVNKNQPINTGDIIVGQYSAENISCYEITEIVERKKSGFSNKDYLKAKTKWSSKKPPFHEFNLLTNNSFNKLFNLSK